MQTVIHNKGNGIAVYIRDDLSTIEINKAKLG